MHPGVLLEGRRGSARPLSVLEHILCLLYKLIMRIALSVIDFYIGIKPGWNWGLHMQIVQLSIEKSHNCLIH